MIKRLRQQMDTIYTTGLLKIGMMLMTAGGIICFAALGVSGQNSASSVIVKEDVTFALMSNGVVIDKKRKLMWAQSDNGSKITIDQAKAYVKKLDLAGFTDWRIPDIQELESLMVHDSPNDTPPTEGCGGNYEIHPFFELTCCCPWALQDGGTRPAAYPFIKKVATGSMWHHKSNKIGNRILPVRDLD